MHKEAERIAKGLYNGTITEGQIDPTLTKLVALELRKAVIEGFGKDLHQLDYGTPDYKKLAQLEKSIYQFSGAKNYQELKSMSLALKDARGLQREFSDFKKEALKIDNAYNGKNLKTEFDTAVAGGQMAAKWVDIKQYEDIYPYLEFDAVIDGKTSDLCRHLNGVLLPINHPFWKQYYPPNHFNCRSTVKQRSAGNVTQQIPDIDIPDMFKTNLAEDGLIFPAKHSYYIGCPPEVLRKAELMRDNIYSPLPRTQLMKKNVYVSNLADEKDVELNIKLSRRLSEYNEEVYIRPHGSGIKNPELQLGAQTGDFKTNINTEIKKFVKNAIDSANTQTTNIPVIAIPSDKYNKELVWHGLRSDLTHTNRKKNITEVWILLDSELVKLTREQIEKGINLLP